MMMMIFLQDLKWKILFEPGERVFISIFKSQNNVTTLQKSET